MRHNFRLLLTTLTTSFVLLACGSSANEDASVNQNLTGNMEVISAQEAEATIPENTLKSADTATPEDSDQSSIEVVETPEVTVDSNEVQTAVDPIVLIALEEIVGTIGLEKESHTFIFDESKDYIEVNVREKNHDGATPLVGTYRYDLKSEKVLAKDYLTGEFIPHGE